MHVRYQPSCVSGFTIVEILVVIGVIAILTVISVVSYSGIIQHAQDSAVRHDIANIATQTKLHWTDNRRFPTVAEFKAIGVHINKQTYGVNPVGATIFYCVDNAGTTYSLVARVKSSTIIKYLSSTDQISAYSGSTTAPQLCLDSGIVGTTSTVQYTGFTNNGSWYPWVLDS
ncbi:putative Type II secretion system protein G [Candidatus Saccharimonas aalborgensis]|jgi:type II secretory pathway pseudopilin PulG|uniref:Putative Type II secretion system protein G n=1 Tax=Candidatus Saccharimonas aalborgensis TaxID=1332188 RepID=R4PJY4_9BACT|nr:putative Type II secretion system protein G [Candidatus Saccharimonas aalborgensis]